MNQLLKKTLGPYGGHAFAVLRIVAGVLFAIHGAQKIFGILGGHQPDVGSQIWIGGAIELVCGLAIALGFFTRVAAFIASGTMAVAYIQFHWKFAFDTSFFPSVNKGELAVLYCFYFLYLSCVGPGRWSLDKE